MKFAVIAAAGSQYRVEEGKEILVDHMDKKEGDVVSFDTMLLVKDSTVKVGTPNVTGSVVTAKVLGHEKGDKIRIARYMAKSRSRTVRGYRHDYTRLSITAIK